MSQVHRTTPLADRQLAGLLKVRDDQDQREIFSLLIFIRGVTSLERVAAEPARIDVETGLPRRSDGPSDVWTRAWQQLAPVPRFPILGGSASSVRGLVGQPCTLVRQCSNECPAGLHGSHDAALAAAATGPCGAHQAVKRLSGDGGLRPARGSAWHGGRWDRRWQIGSGTS